VTVKHGAVPQVQERLFDRGVVIRDLRAGTEKGDLTPATIHG
jgi:hypothetical protein